MNTYIAVSMTVGLLALGQMSSHAWEPNAGDLDRAIKAGDFAGYLANASTWLGQKVPAESVKISDAAMKELLKDPVFVNTLDQRQLISKFGVTVLNAFAKASPANAEFLTWLLKNTQVMNMFLESVGPVAIAEREKNSYTVSVDTLDRWQKILSADPDAKEGICLKLAMATAIAPPHSIGAGTAKVLPGFLDRYKYFKAAQKNNELFPSFNTLTVWEYTKVVSSGASDEDLTWGRAMINTWRPDLRVKEQVVNSTSEVWRRNSPIDFNGSFTNVLAGGGKCGPRSSWAVFICQAFGIPAIGVGQPAHACVADKTAYPELDPQPGNAWKVHQGRGWSVSRLDGTSGPEFLLAVNERSHAVEFSQIEHLRWLASSLISKEHGAAVMSVATKLLPPTPPQPVAPKAPQSTAVKEDEKPASIPEAPFPVIPGVLHIEAEAFFKMEKGRVFDCFTGGKQLIILKNDECKIDYTVDVPATGTYSVEVMFAAANFDQAIDFCVGTNKVATIKLPNTTGLWRKTEPVEVKLEKGNQTLRLATPAQRGITLRWFELKSKKQ